MDSYASTNACLVVMSSSGAYLGHIPHRLSPQSASMQSSFQDCMFSFLLAHTQAMKQEIDRAVEITFQDLA